MSTSSSDGSGSGSGAKPAPDAPAKAGGVGVAGLFARAVAAQKEKAAQPSAVDMKPVEAGVEHLTCGKCGAPRQQEERVCRFCGERI
jgi:hypothetical protein